MSVSLSVLSLFKRCQAEDGLNTEYHGGIAVKVLSIILLLYTTFVAHATPYVTNVVARQRQPWNGLVDVSYEIVGSTNGLEVVYGQLTATDRTRGNTYGASTFEKKIDLTEGKHSAIWNMSADNNFTSKDVVFNMSIRTPALYCVIDLSGGPNATSYPVSDLDDVPAGGWTDEYKTTKLVLRCVDSGSVIVGDDQTDETKRCYITQPFYIGVFEVTQKQYELVTGKLPSRYVGDKRPVEGVSWDQIRGNSDNSEWPSEMIDPETFMGKLCARTDLRFDLPTIAQWQYACRAGTTSKYNNGGDSESDLAIVGRYEHNNSDMKGGYSEHTTVGSYLPNKWGLYDMHGNVFEFCLDSLGRNYNGNYSWYGYLRTSCGGCWDNGIWGAGMVFTEYPYLISTLGLRGFRVVSSSLR